MKPSLKLLYVALERASFTYADTGSVFAKERALELIKETHDCLDDIEQLILSRDAPNTGKLEAVR